MRNALRSSAKISLTFVFWFIINEVVSFLFGNRNPLPTVEDSSIIFFYILIFLFELVLSCLLTYFVFTIVKSNI